MTQTQAFHLEVDRTGDDVARREFGARIETRHEAIAGGAVRIDQAQYRAFTAQRFGDQEIARLAMEQRGRMELHEFHVRNPRSEEHTSELQSLMRISYAVFCLKKKNHNTHKKKLTNEHIKKQHTKLIKTHIYRNQYN